MRFYRFVVIILYGHTHATMLLQGDPDNGIYGQPMIAIKERLGHSNISTTVDLYGHVTKKMQDSSANTFDKIVSTTFSSCGQIVDV